ncbi:alpha-amylase family glycosyl hydrolase [Massilia sp. CFBP9026]|uniref:alpha-amylase family glycosyl hydrolase n=1 Tax=Massilia sp. CFBP9026 TaxID=3096536 RepID=UPI002A6A694A|nr:alpha-amylase family glycosyl hydrolase [Massilia sp. CFBP9026]MDY0962326.1 alpha-amylase family glycosyl hydrolase [Massilia sp. CFBP9026]
MKLPVLAASMLLAFGAMSSATAQIKAPAGKPFVWENATVYFLLTDRFNNGNPANDKAYGRKDDAATMRGFMGGDIAGITAKIKEGYFKDLGVNAIWFTPVVEQIHGSTDEGTGKSYGFHGYWAKDFTALDAAFGTEAELKELVDTAHANGIRIVFDVVMNHTGPVTKQDPVWPASWVRTGPQCTYKDARTTMDCTLVANLPDFLTASRANVELPPHLAAKWKKEGRYEREVKELDDFFKRTGYPRAPRYYLMKWHADWVRKYGIDGFRADTVKHTEPGLWKELKQEASIAFEDWKRANPKQRLGDDKFWMVSEVYNYEIKHARKFDLGGGDFVDYPGEGFDSMISFSLRSDAKQPYEKIFSDYSKILQGEMKGYSVLNYISSHDDSSPFDPLRERPFESANKLLLAPGAAQIYYGDETARILRVEGAEGDATLRSFMNWDELKTNAERGMHRVADIRAHWARLGRFRAAHPAVGAGVHQMISHSPYTFKRTWERNGVSDRVVVALDLPGGQPATIQVGGVFHDGATVRDWYTGKTAVVKGGKVRFDTAAPVALIAQD